jgi:hypothetical protein
MTTSNIDILIVGAGPAGLFLAAQLAKINAFHASRTPKGEQARRITYRIVDKAEHKVLVGHADGQCSLHFHSVESLPDDVYDPLRKQASNAGPSKSSSPSVSPTGSFTKAVKSPKWCSTTPTRTRTAARVV